MHAVDDRLDLEPHALAGALDLALGDDRTDEDAFKVVVRCTRVISALAFSTSLRAPLPRTSAATRAQVVSMPSKRERSALASFGALTRDPSRRTEPCTKPFR